MEMTLQKQNATCALQEARVWERATLATDLRRQGPDAGLRPCKDQGAWGGVAASPDAYQATERKEGDESEADCQDKEGNEGGDESKESNEGC